MRVSSETRGGALLSDFSQFVWTHLGMKRSTLQQRIGNSNRTPLCVTERQCTYTPPVSEMFSLAPQFSDVPQSGHATANTAVPRWHRESKERSLGSPSHINQQVPRPLKPSALWPS